VDCEHLVVEWEAHPVATAGSITTAHRFTCLMCRCRAIVIWHEAVLNTN
jgi:hypothetical protein